MQPLLVSIIMPAYNAELYIEKAIYSIIYQTYQNWELIICDDASTDKTCALIDNFAKHEPRLIISHNTVNQKLLKTRNRLLKLAKGELITFQDADDYSHPERLARMVDEFNSNPKLGLLVTQVAFVNNKDQEIRRSKKPTTYAETLEKMYKKNVVGGSFMMIRKTVLQQVGFEFRPYFNGLSYQDYDLGLLIAQKFEAYSLPHVLYYYRQIENSASKRVDYSRLISKNVVIHLALQRKDSGSDDLINDRVDLVDEYFDKLRSPFIKDPSLVYREYASNFMYNRLYLKAIKTSWHGVLIKPSYIINWRTLLYCLRVSLYHSLLSILARTEGEAN